VLAIQLVLIAFFGFPLGSPSGDSLTTVPTARVPAVTRTAASQHTTRRVGIAPATRSCVQRVRQTPCSAYSGAKPS
jgi:hypothetical protein